MHGLFRTVLVLGLYLPKKFFCGFENKFFTFSYCTRPVPQSNFLSAVIFNFYYVFRFGIFCHFVEICLLHWVSATKESLSWSQKQPFCDQPQILLLHWLSATDKFKWNGKKCQKKKTWPQNLCNVAKYCTSRLFQNISPGICTGELQLQIVPLICCNRLYLDFVPADCSYRLYMHNASSDST